MFVNADGDSQADAPPLLDSTPRLGGHAHSAGHHEEVHMAQRD